MESHLIVKFGAKFQRRRSSIRMKIRPKCIVYSITINTVLGKNPVYSIRMKIRTKSIVYSVRMKIRQNSIVYRHSEGNFNFLKLIGTGI